MEFNQIRYFLALAETLNFTRAAENCCVSQPALTRAIRLLEEELGGQLLIRNGKDTRLSELGRELHGSFVAIEHAKRELKESASAAIAGERGDLNIGIVNTISSLRIVRLLEAFRRQHSGINISIHSVTPKEAGDLLLSGELDVCFTADAPAQHAKVEYTHLYTDKMAVIFPDGHRFENEESVSFDDFAGETIVGRRNCLFHDQLCSQLDKQDQCISISMSADSDEWSARLVRSGAGLAIMPVETAMQLGVDYRVVDDANAHRVVELSTVYGGPKSVVLRAIMRAAENFDWQDDPSTPIKKTLQKPVAPAHHKSERVQLAIVA